MPKPPPEYNSPDPAIYQIYSVFEQVVVHWPSLPNLALTLTRMNKEAKEHYLVKKNSKYICTHIYIHV